MLAGNRRVFLHILRLTVQGAYSLVLSLRAPLVLGGQLKLVFPRRNWPSCFFTLESHQSWRQSYTYYMALWPEDLIFLFLFFYIMTSLTWDGLSNMVPSGLLLGCSHL